MPPCVLVQMLLLRKVPKQFRLAILIKFENDRLAIGPDLARDGVAFFHLPDSIATRIAWRHRMTPVHFCFFEHAAVLHVGLRARWRMLKCDSKRSIALQSDIV